MYKGACRDLCEGRFANSFPRSSAIRARNRNFVRYAGEGVPFPVGIPEQGNETLSVFARLAFPGSRDFILGYGIAALQAAREDVLRRTNHTDCSAPLMGNGQGLLIYISFSEGAYK
jgi:hypothetical protein